MYTRVNYELINRSQRQPNIQKEDDTDIDERMFILEDKLYIKREDFAFTSDDITMLRPFIEEEEPILN